MFKQLVLVCWTLITIILHANANGRQYQRSSVQYLHMKENLNEIISENLQVRQPEKHILSAPKIDGGKCIFGRKYYMRHCKKIVINLEK